MDFPTNPFAVLTFISAPAILTNASCVLLFGTGNRYGRAIDRVHELSEIVQKSTGADEAELRLRIRQLEAAETRTLLIVKALTSFYTAVAGFVGSTLISLIGAVLVYTQINRWIALSFALAFLSGTIGVFAMIAGAMMLSRESRFSFRILREEKNFIAQRISERAAKLSLVEPAK
jgi:Protein of unknown function (DUF2721)